MTAGRERQRLLGLWCTGNSRRCSRQRRADCSSVLNVFGEHIGLVAINLDGKYLLCKLPSLPERAPYGLDVMRFTRIESRA